MLLDNSALVRLWKCDALDLLTSTVHLHVSAHVAKEFRVQGPTERAAFARVGATVHPVLPGTREWDLFSQIRGDRHSTRDLGEEESFPVAIAMAEKGKLLPFVTYDRPATSRARELEIVTLDFLDTLAWFVGCGVLTAERADEIEALASVVDGWRRHHGYTGNIETEREARQDAVIERVAAWRARLGH